MVVAADAVDAEAVGDSGRDRSNEASSFVRLADIFASVFGGGEVRWERRVTAVSLCITVRKYDVTRMMFSLQSQMSSLYRQADPHGRCIILAWLNSLYRAISIAKKVR